MHGLSFTINATILSLNLLSFSHSSTYATAFGALAKGTPFFPFAVYGAMELIAGL
jgi:hypothetical protein